MSQTVEQLNPKPRDESSRVSDRNLDSTSYAGSSSQRYGEFDYKPMPPLAPVTLFLGICSSIALLSELGVGLAFFGLVLGTLCLRQIRRSNDELGGRNLTRIGLVLSMLFFAIGSVWHSYVYATEVPEGFRRISFTQDISKKDFMFEDGKMKLHADVAALAGKDVFVKGYIYQSKETISGLPFNSFVLVKDNQACCFGANPKPTDMIVVQMAKGKTVHYIDGLVSVAGEFRGRAPLSPQQQEPVYGLNATYITRAKTSY